VNQLFQESLDNYNSENYEQALEGFNRVIIDFEYNSRTTISEFFMANILLNLKRLEEFKVSADGFMEKYPESRYAHEIRLLIVKYYLEIANYYNSFREILFIIDKTNSPKYKTKAERIGRGIAAKYLNDTQLQKFYSLFTDDDVRSYVLLQIGKYYLKNRDTFAAKGTFSELMEKFPNSEEYAEAERLYNFSYEEQPSYTIVGVMLPLESDMMGNYTFQPAAEILEGIKFAVNEFNRGRSDKIGLLIRDTKKNTDEIEKIQEEFVPYNSMVAILGPIFSSEVRSALEEFENSDIPIISPTATDDDLTELSTNFFQANPSFSVRGKLMAQYIFYVENKRTVSVLNSINGYSPLLAANFIEEFERLGGKVLRRESFRDSTTDFSVQLSNIYSDSLITEGIYIPLSDNSVTPFIFSELIKYYTKIPMYGNQDWFTAKGFETAPEISNKLVFTSDYFVEFNSEEYFNFNEQFIALTGKDVNRNAFYGYDAAKFLLTAIRNSEYGRENLKSKMISGMISSGLHNNISFDGRGVNRYLNLVRYKVGVFELVDKFRLSQ
jgi:branched-chain amino acid transport system substrate-binding protein